MCMKTPEAETSAYEAAWESWTAEEAAEGSEDGEEAVK